MNKILIFPLSLLFLLGCAAKKHQHGIPPPEIIYSPDDVDSLEMRIMDLEDLRSGRRIGELERKQRMLDHRLGFVEENIGEGGK